MQPITPLTHPDYRANRLHFQSLTKVLSHLREKFTPPHPTYAHISLQPRLTSLETEPMHCEVLSSRSNAADTVLALDCEMMEAHVRRADTILSRTDFTTLSPAQLFTFFKTALETNGVKVPDAAFGADAATLDAELIKRIHAALNAVSLVLQGVRDTLGGEATAVQFWTHHFDLAFNWYKDGYKDESSPMIYHGFSLGDDEHPAPYFSLYVYPWKEEFIPALPAGAVLHTEGWKGILLDYTEWQLQSAPETLAPFFIDAHHALHAAL